MKKIVQFGVAAAATVALAGTALAADWSYDGATGPENWGSLDPAYEQCSSGLMQSPIDLADANARADVSVFTDYQPGPLTILNNGHTVQANFAEAAFAGDQRDEAVDTLLQMVASDRDWNEAAGRQELLKLLDMMGPTNLLTKTLRRQLSTILFA